MIDLLLFHSNKIRRKEKYRDLQANELQAASVCAFLLYALQCKYLKCKTPVTVHLEKIDYNGSLTIL